MPNGSHLALQPRPPRKLGEQQQQGGNDLQSQQQHGGLPPFDDDKLREPRKPDIEEPDEAIDEDHYDRTV